MVWDVQNRAQGAPAQVTGGTTETYLYDPAPKGHPQRVKKTVGSTVSLYPFAHYEITAPQGLPTVTKYYFFAGMRIAMKQGSTLTYLHSDHLGSTVLETNTAGNQTADQKYRAYGKQRDTGAVVTDHKFTGQKLDGTGLQYYQSRYYDPAMGTFISPDTVVPDATSVFGYNRYMYGFGNPLGYSDPNGHEPCPTGAWGDCLPTPSRSFVNNLATSRHQAGYDWEDLSAEMQTVLTSDGLHEGVYNDLGGNATEQTGWRDPATLAATLYGGVRLAWRLPSLLMGACADGDCTNEASTVSETVDETVALYRVVRPEELNDLLRFGDYGLSPSGGGKYFALTEQGARQFAQGPFNTDVNTVLTKIEVPMSFISRFGFQFHDPGTYGAKDSVHFADDVLPYLYQVMNGLPQIMPD